MNNMTEMLEKKLDDDLEKNGDILLGRHFVSVKEDKDARDRVLEFLKYIYCHYNLSLYDSFSQPIIFQIAFESIRKCRVKCDFDSIIDEVEPTFVKMCMNGLYRCRIEPKWYHIIIQISQQMFDYAKEYYTNRYNVEEALKIRAKAKDLRDDFGDIICDMFKLSYINKYDVLNFLYRYKVDIECDFDLINTDSKDLYPLKLYGEGCLSSHMLSYLEDIGEFC